LQPGALFSTKATGILSEISWPARHLFDSISVHWFLESIPAGQSPEQKVQIARAETARSRALSLGSEGSNVYLLGQFPDAG